MLDLGSNKTVVEVSMIVTISTENLLHLFYDKLPHVYDEIWSI
ncbi:MAG: hypothetical protein QXT64_08470 [Desulfurococcaceae archaeon]